MKVNRISATSQASSHSNDDPEEGTRLCYLPFKKKNNHDKFRINSMAEKAPGKKTTEIVAGSFVSLSVAIAKIGGVDVYNVSSR